MPSHAASAPRSGPAAAELARDRVVPVMRFEEDEVARVAADVLVEAGFSVLEVTLTIPGATDLIAELARSERGVMVGAGTVLSVADAERCFAAGARFVVSPCIVPGLAEASREAGVACLMGTLTPSEVAAAWREGVTAVKVFPASSVGGPAYVKAVKSVMPDVPIVPTGGVSLDAIPAYLRAGALAVGVGSELFDSAAIADGRREDAVARARRYLDAGRSA